LKLTKPGQGQASPLISVFGGLVVAWRAKDQLCQIDPNQSIVHLDSSFLAMTGSDFGTSMPTKSQEEPVPSLKLTKAGRLRSFAA
jgi:hypothetical protein